VTFRHRGPTRRRVLAGIGAAGLFGGNCLADGIPPRPALHEAAGMRGILYGSCIAADQVRAGGDFTELVRRECAVLVPENEMKWGDISTTPQQYDFSGADAIVDFATANDIALRGHTLLWYFRTPKWFFDLDRAGAERAMLTHIATMAGRYRGKILFWDVVNEPVEPKDGRADGLRRGVFADMIGPHYIELALEATRAADPTARLLLNEYDVEYDTPEHEERRRAVLRLLERLKRQGTPVEALGIQAHLDLTGRPFSAKRLRDFLSEVASLGLSIAITELDVADSAAPADIAWRDRLIADEYARFLDVALAEPAVSVVMTWGLSDRHSWRVRGESGDKRIDGALPRPLPFDAALKPKPAWRSLIEGFDTAAVRDGGPISYSAR
jgi:endo-1,4-beta-xylanase